MVQKVVLEVSVVTLVLIEGQDLVQELLLSQLQLLLRAITYSIGSWSLWQKSLFDTTTNFLRLLDLRRINWLN